MLRYRARSKRRIGEREIEQNESESHAINIQQIVTKVVLSTLKYDGQAEYHLKF